MDDVRGDFLGPPHGTTPAAVIANKNNCKIFLKIYVIYSHGGRLGHVAMTIYANFHSLFLRMLHIKFGFD